MLTGGRIKVTSTDDDHRHRLVIDDVQQSDDGQYVVKLTDHHDQTLVQSMSARLVVVTDQMTTAGMYTLHTQLVA